MGETHNFRCSECGRRGHNARTCDAPDEERITPRKRDLAVFVLLYYVVIWPLVAMLRVAGDHIAVAVGLKRVAPTGRPVWRRRRS
ncbi:MAG TPA: hypothetical protein VLT45_22020 [Kofleriaceae bacterium]|nr:hypothetical protein [Kofleriaceae bacterium]